MSGKKLPTKTKRPPKTKKFTYLKDRGSILGIKIGVFHHHLENNIPSPVVGESFIKKVQSDLVWASFWVIFRGHFSFMFFLRKHHLFC